MTSRILSDGSILASGVALNWLIQSTVLLVVGLALGRLLRPAGAAVQSAVYQATLATVLACPIVSAALLAAGIKGPRIPFAAIEATEVESALAPPAVATGREGFLKPVPGEMSRPSALPIIQTTAKPAPAGWPVMQQEKSRPRLSMAPAIEAKKAGGPRVTVAAIATIIGGVWLTVTLVMLTRLAVSHLRLSRLRRHAFRVEPETESLTHDLARSLGVSPPQVLRTPYLASPCLCGLRRPAILLPEDEEDPREAIVHELAHLARRDVAWNLLRQVACALLWVQPLVWALARRIEATAEEVCDDVVVAHGADRARYASLLLEIAERSLPPASPALVGIVVFRSSLGSRVRRILDASRPLSTRAGRRALAATVSLGLAGTLIASLVGIGRPAPATAAVTAPATAPQVDKDKGNPETPFEFHLRVVGPTGNPVPGASVEIRTSPAPNADAIKKGQFVRAGSFGTFARADDQGRLNFVLPGPPDRFNINIQEPGYGPYWAEWSSSEHPQSIPEKFVAELDEGWRVGGIVVDPEGKPVEGVKIHPFVEYKKRPGDTSQLYVGTQVTTDAEGHWRYETVPASRSDVHVSFNHPDYAPLRISLPRDRIEVSLDEDRSPARIELKPGLTVTGTVTDEQGQPIPDALVRTKFLNEIREAKTDKQGHYRLEGCEPKMARVVVSAEGRALDMKEVRVDPDMEPVNFTMQPGRTIRVRVVDEQGNGLPRARIFFQRWRGMIGYFEFDHVDQYADEEGFWVWNEAPADEILADICRPDGMQLSKQSLVAQDEEYVFTPPPALVVSGRVVDAQTKQPVESFRVTPGLRNSDPRIGVNWIPGESYQASNGEYRVRFSHDYPAHLVRVEAAGYRVAVSRDINSSEGEVTVDFELEPAPDIAVTLLTAAGKPASRAQIALGVAGNQISIEQGQIDKGSTYATTLQADDEGRFRMPARDEPFQLVITHPAGFAHLKSESGQVADQVTLTPWARVEGTFRVGSRPASNVVLWLSGEGIHSYGDDVPNIFTRHEVTTGEDGRFVFERAFPGKARIGRNILLMVDDGATEVTSSKMMPVKLEAGKTTQLGFSPTGCPVVGTLEASTGHSRPVLWNFALVDVRADLPPLPRRPAPPDDLKDDPERLKKWWDAWNWTLEGKQWAIANEVYERSPYFTATVDRDGTFRIDDMPAGDYVLSVRFSQHEAGLISGYNFSVPAEAAEGSALPINLGTLKLIP